MDILIVGIVVASSLWMAFDARQIGYDKKDVKGMAGMGPVSWLFAGQGEVPEPNPSCGDDLTADTLGCASTRCPQG